jgi:hypothetical protein
MAAERDSIPLSSAASQVEITSSYRRLLREPRHPHAPPGRPGRGTPTHTFRLHPSARPGDPHRTRPGSSRIRRRATSAAAAYSAATAPPPDCGLGRCAGTADLQLDPESTNMRTAPVPELTRMVEFAF